MINRRDCRSRQAGMARLLSQRMRTRAIGPSWTRGIEAEEHVGMRLRDWRNTLESGFFTASSRTEYSLDKFSFLSH
jgi:hypothetical protein